MSKRAKSLIQYVIIFGIAILLVWLSLREIAPEKDKVIFALTHANYFWVALSMMISFLGHFLRAYRWNYLLKPLGYKVGLVNATGSVFIGYFANYALPRLGEVSRCTVAARYDKVPFEVALGTVITERIVDLALLIIVFFLTLFAQFHKLIGLANEHVFYPLRDKLNGLSDRPVLMWSLIAVFAAGIVLFFALRKKISSLLRGKFGKVIKGFGEGIVSVKSMKHKGRFILLSVLIWATYFYSLYVAFFAFEETSRLGQAECLTLLLFGTFGVIFTPGGLGVYPKLIKEILTFYSISVVTAFSFPWLTWATQFILIGVMGCISLIVLPIANRNKSHAVPS